MEHASRTTIRASALQLQAYRYNKLPPGGFFRYLVLQPGSGDEPLQCKLHTSLLGLTTFEALSYVWGTIERERTICCDGQTLKITPNLDEALRRLRLLDEPRKLWADSICINQQDSKEKSRQVSMMSRIYRKANRVLLYVGPDPGEEGSKVRTILEEVRNFIDGELSRLDISGWDTFPYPNPDNPILVDPRWSSVNKLICQTWFCRGWVVREAALARSGTMIWGQNEFNWDDLMRAIIWILARVKNIAVLAREYFEHLSPHVFSYAIRNQDQLSMFLKEWALKDVQLLDCLHYDKILFTDPRDRIYAFQDILPNLRGVRIAPNYGITPAEVYRDFSLQYIRATRDSSILDYIEHNRDSLQSGQPTWVPSSVAYAAPNAFRGQCSKALLSKSGLACEPKVIGNILKVRGVVFDTIHFVSDTLQESTTTLKVIFNLWCLVRDCTSSTPYSATHQLEAFVNTLLIDSHEGEVSTWYQAESAYVQEMRKNTGRPEAFKCSGSEEHIKKLDYVDNEIRAKTDGGKFFITKRGYMGIGPAVARKGDLCGIVFGCRYPCLMRAVAQTRFLGPAYILGGVHTEISDPESGVEEDYVQCSWQVFGDEGSKEWVDWGVEEQDIYLS